MNGAILVGTFGITPLCTVNEYLSEAVLAVVNVRTLYRMLSWTYFGGAIITLYTYCTKISHI